MKRIIILLLTVQVICSNYVLNAQYKTVKLPTTPEAAILHKFIDIPVDLNSGVPKITIDIFKMKFRDFTLPININYHSVGNKVSDISSNVGLGWSLNAGGLISTSVNGVPDIDEINGYHMSSPNITYDKYLDSGFLSEDFNVGDPFDDYETLNKIATGEIEGEPDLFYYNYLGRGGVFVFDENLNIRKIPHNSNMIAYENNEVFKITDEKGVVYSFAHLETSTIIGGGEGCPTPDWFNGYDEISYSPTWHLKSIKAINGDSVTFEYQSVNYSYEILASQFDSHWKYWDRLIYAAGPTTVPGCGSCISLPISTCLNTMEVSGVRIHSIKSSNGDLINFEYSPIEREDLSGTNQLNKISIHNSNDLIKSWILNYDYFDGEKKKLKLISIRENDNAPYSFFYNDTYLVSRLSTSQDHWGYFNGKSNPSLLPRILLRSEWLAGADREPDFESTLGGVLASIKYPTGGSTKFEYEQNKYWFEGDTTIYTDTSSSRLSVDNNEILSGIVTTFTITSPKWATFNFNIQYFDESGNPATPPPGNVCYAEITPNADFGSSNILSNTPKKEIILLLPGEYQMKLTATSEGFFGFCQVNWVSS